jgi:hypothetical protein
MRAIWRQNLKLIISPAYVNFCVFIADVHDEGDTTPEYQPPEIPDMDIKPMMKGKEDFRSVLSSVCQIRIRIGSGFQQTIIVKKGKKEDFISEERLGELEVDPERPLKGCEDDCCRPKNIFNLNFF